MSHRQHVATNQPAAEDIRALQDRVLGYPRVGVHVGGGIHVAMPATWDGQGVPPPGWTATHDRPRQEASSWILDLADNLEAALQANGSRLTAAERGRLQAAIAGARPTPEPDPPVSGSGGRRT